MKTLRMFLLAALLALGVATPVVSALTTIHAQASPSTITRVADEPTPTPNPSGNPYGPCPSQGC